MTVEIGPESGFVVWNFSGKPPDAVEYELSAPDLEPRLVRAAVNTAIEFDCTYSLRYRGVWNGKAGPWNDDPYRVHWEGY